jgi:hypothetical protein
VLPPPGLDHNAVEPLMVAVAAVVHSLLRLHRQRGGTTEWACQFRIHGRVF